MSKTIITKYRVLSRLVLRKNHGRLLAKVRIIRATNPAEYRLLSAEYPYINIATEAISNYSGSNASSVSSPYLVAVNIYKDYAIKVQDLILFISNMQAQDPILEKDSNLEQLKSFLPSWLEYKDYKSIDACQKEISKYYPSYSAKIKQELDKINQELLETLTTVFQNPLMQLLYQYPTYYAGLDSLYNFCKNLNQGILVDCKKTASTKVEFDANIENINKALTLSKEVAKELALIPNNQKALTVIARTPKALMVIQNQSKELMVIEKKCTALIVIPAKGISSSENSNLQSSGLTTSAVNIISAIWNAPLDAQTLLAVYKIQSDIKTILTGVGRTAIDVTSLVNGVSIISYILKGTYTIWQAGGIVKFSTMIHNNMVELNQLLTAFSKNPNPTDLKRLITLIGGVLALIVFIFKVLQKCSEKEILDEWKKVIEEIKTELANVEKELGLLKKSKSNHAQIISDIEKDVTAIKSEITKIENKSAGILAEIWAIIENFTRFIINTDSELTTLQKKLDEEKNKLSLALTTLKSLEGNVSKNEEKQRLLLSIQKDLEFLSVFNPQKVITEVLKVLERPTPSKIKEAISNIQHIGISTADLKEIKGQIVQLK